MTHPLLEELAEDLRTVRERDPSVRTAGEAVLRPALTALWSHRVAHRLHRRGWHRSAQLLAYTARLLTAVEIHPGAVIGRRVLIDHGAGVVIGETARVGDDVTLYHQVTLGAVGWWRDQERPEGSRRHPVIGNHVVIGANATILGPVTIGEHAVVGAQALVHTDVPAYAKALAPAATVGPVPAPPSQAELRAVTASTGCW